MLYLLLITCVPFTTIVVGRFVHSAPAIWLYAGHTLLIATSLLAIALSFVNPRVALRALALNFAGSPLRKWSRRGEASD